MDQHHEIQNPPAPAAQAPENGETAVPGWVERQAYDYTAMSAPVSTQAWDGSAKVYQWSDDYGDVGPEFPELEIELFGDPDTRHERAGLDFSKIDQIDVVQEGPTRIQPVSSFKDAGLHPVMLKNVELSGYEVPTPIQKFTVPAILQGYDVIGIAQTGSGKTAAYMVPILSKLMGKAKKLAAPRPNPATFREGVDNVTAEPLVLVVVPTRELAVQIFNETRKLCYRSMLRPCVVYGGVSTREQLGLLTKGCDILIGTPGRLKDIMSRPQYLTLRRLKYMILDEADEMLDSSWEEDLRDIFSGGDQDDGNVKYGLFSATFPKAARELAKTYLSSSHVRFRVGRAGSTTENIKQMVIQASPHTKNNTLLTLLGEMHGVRTIIFVNSRQAADTLDDFLYNMRLPVTSIHSDRTQVEREAAMRAFRAGVAPILVATGVTARGIDVRNVQHVINYDLPSMEHGGIEEYTHRIGRTGRMGHRGVATSFFTDRDEPIASVLTRTLMETNQVIPEFLQTWVPEDAATGGRLQFETESDFDPSDVAGAGEAWGQGNAAADSGADGVTDWNTGGAVASAADSGNSGWGGGDQAANSGDAWGANAGTSGWNDGGQAAGSGDAWGGNGGDQTAAAW